MGRRRSLLLLRWAGIGHVEFGAARPERPPRMDELADARSELHVDLSLHIHGRHGALHASPGPWPTDLLVRRLRDIGQLSLGLLVGQHHLHRALLRPEAFCVCVAAAGHRALPRRSRRRAARHRGPSPLHPGHRVGAAAAWALPRQVHDLVRRARLADLRARGCAEGLAAAVRAGHLPRHLESRPAHAHRVVLLEARRQRDVDAGRQLDVHPHCHDVHDVLGGDGLGYPTRVREKP
mmetsp:Transcript_29257/g.97159  ORF Transcript_29257/g.97159 Transcript_29257/m.97159 type:complete len:236 (-) Transcript_29257:797-1504(-)